MEENPCIWTIGDTLITSGDLNLSFESSKIFEINVTIRPFNSLFGRPQFSQQVGYAFAGSSMVGLNTFATLSGILSNLTGRPQAVPSIKNIAATALKIIDTYASSICSPSNNFEALIYGYCYRSTTFKRFHISKLANSNSACFGIHQIPDNEIFLMGDKKQEIYDAISQLRENPSKGMSEHRIPVYVLSDIINDRKYPTIGGSIQMNICNKNYCYPMQAVGLKNDSDMRYRNFDLHADIGLAVGPCIFNMVGMYLKSFPPKENT